MTTYLHIIARTYHVLIDTRSIREVLDSDTVGDGQVNEWHLWRDAAIQTRDLRRMLGELSPLPHRGALVYAEQDQVQPLILLCDGVLGLVRAEDTDFCDVPRNAGAVAGFVDRIMPDSSGNQLLFRLRKGIWNTGHQTMPDMRCSGNHCPHSSNTPISVDN